MRVNGEQTYPSREAAQRAKVVNDKRYQALIERDYAKWRDRWGKGNRDKVPMPPMTQTDYDHLTEMKAVFWAVDMEYAYDALAQGVCALYIEARPFDWEWSL